MELFEQIRREYEHGVGSVAGVARKFGVHLRMVRQALASAIPPERKAPERESPQIEPVKEFIDSILEADRKAPRKQRHTAHRIWRRIRKERPECEIGESTVRRYVRARRQETGQPGKAEVFIEQSYHWGVEAQVDWYEAVADLGEGGQEWQVFSMRSMASGGAFHCAYPRATQQAFLEAHEKAFAYFGGVNWYSTPLRAGVKARVDVLPSYIEVRHDGKCAARHERCYEHSRKVLDLEHYLPALLYKPGALAGSTALEQWRSQGRWPESFDRFWAALMLRRGRQEGTREMVELVLLGREHGYRKLDGAIRLALELGCSDAAAVQHLLTTAARGGEAGNAALSAAELGGLSRYERPQPVMHDYDQLLLSLSSEVIQ